MTEIITVLSSDVSILSSIAVSRLMPVYSLDTLSLSADQYKLLVSEPCEDTSTKHISKFVPLGDVISVIRNQFAIDKISDDIQDLSSDKSDRREVELADRGGWFQCETARNPYIISSIYETNNGNISALDGYDLSAGMDQVFENTVFRKIKALSVETSHLCCESLSLTGSHCDVLYTTPSGAVKQPIFSNTIYVCENDDDISKCADQTSLTTLVDTRDKSLSTYDSTSDSWNHVSSGNDVLQTCGFGRLVKNPLTGKVFYVGQNGFDIVSGGSGDSGSSEIEALEKRIKVLEDLLNDTIVIKAERST